MPISSINNEQIVPTAVAPDSITDDMLVQDGGVLEVVDVITSTSTNLYDPHNDTPNTYVDASGEVRTGNSWDLSDYIELVNGAKHYIKLFNSTGESNVRYAYYDSGKTFKGRVIGGPSEKVKYLTGGSNLKYIRLIIFNSNNSVGTSGDVMVVKSKTEPMEYVKPYSAKDTIARSAVFDQSFISFDTSGFVAGKAVYYSTSKHDEVIEDYESTSYSPPIAVSPRRRVNLVNIFKYAYSYATCYDENMRCIGKIESSTSGGTASVLVTIPHACYYIRVNVATDSLSAFNAYYYDSDDVQWKAADEFVRAFNVVTEGHALDLFGGLKSGTPMISFVDDDTTSLALVRRYHDAMVNAGGVGNYAVITFRLDNDASLASELLAYEDEGFGMLFHCRIQQDYFRNTEARDLAACEENVAQGLRKMRTFNFNCYDLWATPYGVRDNDIIELAKRHGIKALFSTALDYPVKPWLYANKWTLPRYPLNETDAVSPRFTLQGLKDLIDTTVAEHGWLIVTTHVNEWGDTNAGETRIAEAVQYATNAGMQVKNVYEAYESFKPLLDYNEMFR